MEQTAIGTEQKGFLPNRHMKDNVRCVLDITEYYETFHQKELALITIDAKKAFDNLNWDFFKLLLKELDIGYHFINAIEAIYTNQEAKLLINGQHSKLIQIEKGTRQGCPLSPLIFIFALEILIRNIRTDNQLKGTKIRNQEYKVRAFADDIVCFIEDPHRQITKWINNMENFGKVAEFFINKEKTKISTKNITRENQRKLEESTGFETVTKVKYLGIWITAKNAHLLKNNYQNKWKEIKTDLQNWQNLNISLLGRIATIKMNVLPKLMYLFQNLPILRTQKLFQEWNKDIAKFVWKGKRPRIKYSIMTDATKRGGFGLPNIQLYYEACALQWVKDWTTLEDNNILTLEGFDLRRGWHAYVGYDKRKVEKNFGNHFIRAALIKVWEKYKMRFYNKTPLWISSLESSQRHILQWTVWPRYKELLVKRNGIYELKSQEMLKENFKNMSWFQYAVIKEQYIKDSQIGFNDPNVLWDRIMLSKKKVISTIYNTLLEWSTETIAIKNCMINWARNIGHPIMLADWERIWNKKLKYTYAIEIKENWLKTFHRWYMTPKKLGQMYKSYNNSCWKCKIQEGSFYHTWWSCEMTKKYWKIIHEETQNILKKKFPIKPEYYLLGITDSDAQFDKNDDILFMYSSTAARIVFAKFWKLAEIPPKEAWLQKLIEIQEMDELTFLLRESRGKSIKQTNWGKLRNYIAQ
uniref:Reverse transcriptase domain-containing protein n=1 Tax=Anolis carolinensis TaxID=28377 RepID=G1KW06_ANOCA